MIFSPLAVATSHTISNIEQFCATHETLMIGLVTYAGSIVLLNMLENTVNKLDLRSTLPRQKLSSSQFTQEQRDIMFTTPLTIDFNRLYPKLEELQTPYLVAINFKSGIYQYITTDTSFNIHISGIQERSPEWSKMFDTNVYVFKKKII